MSDDSLQDAPVARPQRRHVPRTVLISVVIWLIAMIGFRLAPNMGQAIINIATMALTMLLAIVLMLYFLFMSSFSRRTRGVVALSSVFLAIAFTVTVKVVSFSGDIIPVFVWRWSAAPDTLLDQITDIPITELVDLSVTSNIDFPRFLGPDGSAAIENVRWLSDTPAEAVTLKWRSEIGAGWSGFVARNGYAITMQQRGPDEVVSCHKIETGELVWASSTQTRHETVLGGIGPRSTPTIDKGRVYSVGAHGMVRCIDGGNGNQIWQADLLEMIGSTPAKDIQAIAWGRSNSPLVDGDRVIVPIGGPPGGPFFSLIALDAVSGEPLWKAGDRQVSYRSPRITEFAGQRQIVSVNENQVSGHEIETGEQLWAFDFEGSSNTGASVSQAVPIGDDMLLVSKEYGVGSAVMKITENDGSWQVDEVWADSTVMKTKFTNVTLHEGYVYGLSDGILECIEAKSGTRQWKKKRFGQGQLLRLADRLLVLAENGQLWFVTATPSGYQPLGSVDVLNDKCWATLCLYDNLLLVRSETEVACYELPIERN